MAKSKLAIYLIIAGIGGIAAANFEVHIGWLFLFSVMGALLLFLNAREWKVFFLIIISLASYFYFFIFTSIRLFPFESFLGQMIEFRGVVISDPRTLSKGTSLDLYLNEPLEGRVQLTYFGNLDFEISDILLGTGLLQNEVGRGETPRLLRVAIHEVVKNDQGNFYTNFFGVKKRFLELLRGVLPTDSAALASGILFGYRGDFSPRFYEAMKDSGTTHLVALSGYNIGVLILGFGLLFSSFFNKQTTFYCLLVIIPLFVVFVGAEASIVRASLMSLLVLWARLRGRLTDFSVVLVWTVALMLLIDPTLLRFDIGFQLSFLSFIGVNFFTPIILFYLERLLTGKTSILLEILSLTLGAQVMVLPILFFYFGQFSITAIIVNVLVVPLVPLGMFLVFLISFLGLINPFFGNILGWLAMPLFDYFVWLIYLAAEFAIPFSFRFGIYFLFASYLFLALVIYFFRRKSSHSYFPSL